MTFLNPIAFWGLLALIIPTVILLLSKEKQKLIEFGSLEFLEESESKVARSLFPTQWLQYLLRMTILGLLVLLLAEPVFDQKPNQKRILIEEKVFNDPSFANVLNELGEAYEVVNPKSLNLLIAELNKEGDSTVVYTRSLASDFVGEAQQVDSHIEWKIVPYEQQLMVIDTIKLEDDERLLTITSSEEGLKWTIESMRLNESLEKHRIPIQIYSSNKHEEEAGRLKKVLSSYEKVIPLQFDFAAINPAWIITIDTLVPSEGGHKIHWYELQGRLEVSYIDDVEYHIKGELTEDNLVGSDFAQHLAHIFLDDLFDLKDLDRRVFVPQQSVQSTVLQAKPLQRRKDYYWWTGILLLILVERWYSHKFARG